ncbi:hypothetical protein E4U23_002266 [Claviceps purpurea]|nr:hypothetical protein E4U51_006144 [Claviceps purpurea]KAG6181042.1 hypothetical protein E4U36_004373 [Claviceps purpurea]KAG6193616.1 hypothetical protein E4U27_005898 [Claviceps purpurea]KAG6249267.1 hypothetical protein E4U23_002266 [Claviceps purpurea]
MGSRLARRRPYQDALRPMVRAERFEVSREDDGDGGEAAMHPEYNNSLYETGTDSRRHNQQLSVVKPKAKPATRQGLAASAPRSGVFRRVVFVVSTSA